MLSGAQVPYLKKVDDLNNYHVLSKEPAAIMNPLNINHKMHLFQHLLHNVNEENN